MKPQRPPAPETEQHESSLWDMFGIDHQRFVVRKYIKDLSDKHYKLNKPTNNKINQKLN